MMNDSRTVRYEQQIPDVLRALADVHTAMDSHGFDRKLSHLIMLRASQINNCEFCIDMHTRDALQDGEAQERINSVAEWKDAQEFDAREKAGFAWAEALTYLEENVDLGSLRAELRNHFSEQEIGVLTATVGMINLWNRINISRH